MANNHQPLSDRAKNFIQMEARGVPRDVILQEVFHYPPGTKDKKLLNKADSQMHRWREHPEAKAYWDKEIAKMIQQALPGAFRTLINQSTNDDGEVKKGWLANKASNDLANLAKAIGIVKTEETALQIQINGMPDIGSPDDDQ